MKKRLLASLLTGLLIVGVLPVGASAEWKRDNTGWWYSDWDSWYIGWKEIDGKWYYFDYNGYMAHDTTIDGYQLGSDGARIERIYQAGEKWIVDGQWEFTINSVESTKYRNEFWDKNPEQVVIINYSYKNLGYSNSYMDLYFSSFTVMDEKGVVAELYPANTKYSPKETPIGATCDKAQAGYGLSNKSSSITIQVEEYSHDSSGNSQKQKATFKVPVK
ncbi:hypothetical protein LF65_02299 [Clostridium beijerinckii]|uniref:Cell wall-binding protein n=1 Tax=Clostridium beijerinckii TaxID=1520 RepID=A0A0B5QD51_CLOBE|nr:hypothetical protein [Clostridium beijerinckii]AJG98885.1 hypothetical protein LF65_02299 [Clostridium beijerinckii]